MPPVDRPELGKYALYGGVCGEPCGARVTWWRDADFSTWTVQHGEQTAEFHRDAFDGPDVYESYRDHFPRSMVAPTTGVPAIKAWIETVCPLGEVR